LSAVGLHPTIPQRNRFVKESGRATQPRLGCGRPTCIDETALITEAFDRFYRDERRRVVAFAYALSGSRTTAEDLAQDAFVAVHGRWDEIDNPSAYIRQVVANLATSGHRRAARESRLLARLRGRREEFVELVSEDADFWRAVGALAPRQRAVVALFYVDDQSVAQIAETLGIAPGTVKRTLHDARAVLAGALGASYSEEAE
jgi:RNA polymerase sigma-70 factor (ECF subfamily)